MYAAEATNHQEGSGCESGHPGLAEDHWRSVGSLALMPWTSDGSSERGEHTIAGMPLMTKGEAEREEKESQAH